MDQLVSKIQPEHKKCSTIRISDPKKSQKKSIYQNLTKHISKFQEHHNFLLVSCLKAQPMERCFSRKGAKPFYCHNTLPATAYQLFLQLI